MYKIDYFRDKDINLIKDNIDSLIKMAEIKKIKTIGPYIEDYHKIKKIILEFIKNKKRILYGGSAWDILIKNINPNDGFYKEYDMPDIDFYSPDPINDLKDLCDILSKEKYEYISGQNANHDESYKIFINFHEYCNITYMPANIFYSILYISIDNIKLIHPKVAMIDILRQYNDPINSYYRLDKIFNRANILFKHYPLEVSNIKQDLPKINKSSSITKYILNYLCSKKTDKKLIWIGSIALQFYLNPDNKSLSINEDIKYPLDCITSYYEDDVKDIYHNIQKYYSDNNKLLEFTDNIKVIEYQTFFQYYDKKTEFLYNNELFLTIYGNNDYCIPYNNVNYNKFNILIGTYNVCFMYYLIKYHYQYINKDRDSSYITNYILYLMNKSKTKYLNDNKLTVLDNSIFQDFKIDCYGNTIDPGKKFRISLIEAKKGKYNFIKSRIPFYDPNDDSSKSSFNTDSYVFSNSSGNPIINPKELIINFNYSNQ